MRQDTLSQVKGRPEAVEQGRTTKTCPHRRLPSAEMSRPIFLSSHWNMMRRSLEAAVCHCEQTPDCSVHLTPRRGHRVIQSFARLRDQRPIFYFTATLSVFPSLSFLYSLSLCSPWLEVERGGQGRTQEISGFPFQFFLFSPVCSQSFKPCQHFGVFAPMFWNHHVNDFYHPVNKRRKTAHFSCTTKLLIIHSPHCEHFLLATLAVRLQGLQCGHTGPDSPVHTEILLQLQDWLPWHLWSLEDDFKWLFLTHQKQFRVQL